MFSLKKQAGAGEPRHAKAGGNRQSRILGRLFRHVAFWEAISFLMLICVVWALQFCNVGVLGRVVGETECNVTRSLYLTLCIALVGFITVAHTFIQQRIVLEGLVISCSYCRRIRINGATWQHLESYLTQRTHARFSHGICPDCFARATQQPDRTLDLPVSSDPPGSTEYASR